MVPLYRLSEAHAAVHQGQGTIQGRVVDEEAAALAGEVVGQLRSLVGGDEVAAGLNAAREAVQARRSERRRRQAVQVRALALAEG